MRTVRKRVVHSARGAPARPDPSTGSGEGRTRLTAWRSVLIHLRLHFQLLLAPVFLWGWLVAGGGFSWSIVLAFVAMHAFLYTGATAFNSYYDRDVGPIGGLAHPPPVVAALLPVSLALKLLGLLLASLVNLLFALVYATFALLSIAYSHPRVRLKGDPWASLVTVGFGQGVLAFLGAWAATRGELGAVVSSDGVLGALAATLLILALYPLTQLYQVDEDRKRGDRTIAVVGGARLCFAFSLVCQVLGGAAMLAVVVGRYGPGDGLLILFGLAGQAVVVTWWARHFDPLAVLGNFRIVSALNRASAALLGVYLVARLLMPR
ncbi:MAG TPA: UbiA family prenyltransferase [Chloroflexota bacterium]|nr:UbiA family prenyltransferase [Chloroflexota bacterium]